MPLYKVPYGFTLNKYQEVLKNSYFKYKDGQGPEEHKNRKLFFQKFDAWGRARFKVESSDGTRLLVKSFPVGFKDLLLEVPDKGLEAYL